MGKGLLYKIGGIANEKACLNVLKGRCKKSTFTKTKDDDLIDYINSIARDDNPLFFNSDYESCDEYLADFCLVFSGLKADKSQEGLWFQFSRSSDGDFRGAFVGTVKDILTNQSESSKVDYSVSIESVKNTCYPYETPKKELSKKDTTKKKTDTAVVEKIPAPQVFINEMYDRLLIKDHWLYNDNLWSYLKVIVGRINFLVENKEDVSRYLIKNKTGTKALFNSGLLDSFGNQIMLKVSLNVKGCVSLNGVSIVNGKNDLLSEDFIKVDLEKGCDRVKFCDDRDLIFKGKLEDFDLSIWGRLVHCLVERKDRFPEQFKDYTTEMLCQDMLTSLKFSLSLAKNDPYYIKPIYNARKNRVNYIIPYHPGCQFSEKPKLGMVVDKDGNKEFYEVCTILDYDQCMLDIKTVSLYPEVSF